MLEPESPFYLTVNLFKPSVQGQQNDCTWFNAQPMRVNKLNSILKDMCEVGGNSSIKLTTPGEKHSCRNCKIMMSHQIK